MIARPTRAIPTLIGLAALGVALLALAACGPKRDMREQAYNRPLTASAFFSNGASARPLVEGTVAQGDYNADAEFETGLRDGYPVLRAPMAVDAETLRRGQERFGIYCSMCHGYDGYGRGIVIQRGYTQPPSLHIDRIRRDPDGDIFRTISLGFGRMPPYAEQIPVADRWAIVVYLRALQLSQHASANDVPPERRAALEGSDG